MNSVPSSSASVFPLRLRHMVLGGIVIGFTLVVVGIVGLFQLSPETAVLRESVTAGLSGGYSKKIALHVGVFTTALARIGSRLFKLPPEPQAAFDSIRAAEVGIYKIQGAGGWVDHGAILARSDKAMSARRWDRIVGVSHENNLVAVYCPRRAVSTERVKCCVLVLQGDNLVVAGASGNLDPMLKILDQHFDLNQVEQRLALR